MIGPCGCTSPKSQYALGRWAVCKVFFISWFIELAEVPTYPEPSKLLNRTLLSLMVLYLQVNT